MHSHGVAQEWREYVERDGDDNEHADNHAIIGMLIDSSLVESICRKMLSFRIVQSSFQLLSAFLASRL